MQTRYATARATVTQYTHPVPILKNTFSPYGNSDDDSDGPPPSLKKTDATEMKIDKYLQVFIEALPHLESLHYRFKLQASNEKGYCICSLAKCLTPWRRKYDIVDDHSLCGIRFFFKVIVFFKIVVGRVMNIIQQLLFILHHSLKKEWD